MQKLSVRKLSILGLVLMAASAVTAAVIPAKSDTKEDKKFVNGSLTQDSESPDNGTLSSVTCEAASATGGQVCNISASATTGVGNGSDDTVSSATADGGAGADNTSDAS